jgi:hypothetical protein
VIVLITSVRYADFLAVTLPAWRRFLPAADLRVVTTKTDHWTRRVALQTECRLHQTGAFYAGGARFNRAKALDHALRGTTSGTVCLSVDADTFPQGQFPPEDAIEPDTIYGCARYHCPTPSDLVRFTYPEGGVPREALPLMASKLSVGGYATVPNDAAHVEQAAAECLGYFQCFRFGSQRFGSFPTAGGYDTAFARAFVARRPLFDVYALHLGPSSSRNWTGRTLPRWESA